jgi:hypothetical protein
MRFFFGLIIGAVVTLFVATAFNVPTHVLADKGMTSWNDFLLSTGNALFEFPKAPAAAPEAAVADQAPADEADEGFYVDIAADEDVVASPPDMPVALMSEPRDLDTLLEAEGLPLQPEPQDPEPAVAVQTPAMDFDPSTQTVWVPFRSQLSATGFASRLTGKLDHPFEVSREGPGRYQVIFSYANELERLAVLDQVQSVTGQDPR